MGSILGYGTIVISSYGSAEHFSKVARPLEFRKKVQEAKQQKKS